ncbi:type III PLP-dependent enzyme [Streptomyces sp. SL13]|uniref:Type III PLP-dependent enzyme n=1 Tax=Streptantibioticus silvisoli TaxID=2705255 RepID=A0AA90KH29_9ACTN|nr:type III PLP-dependent enzyme [Streptantibioticus silvisoli]MDI5964576.1 type III PLP-dependent enzyme [Streptantibioticus silvisoli]MDI5970919.1 type III PLP-dependent enzyme [Streptantibioticus silvisoli]
MKIQGIEYEELAQEFGTPLYVYDADVLTGAITGLRDVLHPALEVFYSLKANPNISVFDVLREGGARAEVSSLVELRTALAAGAPPSDIIFLGPGKSERELAACLDAGVHAIVCESFDELDDIERLAGERGVRQRVLLRINPERTIGGSRLTMGGKPRQFGIDEAQVLSAGDLAKKYRYADVAGIHVYLGTRILDAAVVGANTRYILDLADRVAHSTGIRLDTVDIGGGLGVAYFDGEADLDPADVAAQVNPLLEAFTADHPGTRLIMEAGRYLAGRAGVYVMAVRYVKESMGERFAIADGGTHHHMAAVGIGSFVKRNFPAVLLSRRGDDGGAGEPQPWNVTGPLCTPNDSVLKRAALPALERGDLIGITCSGAYGPSASPGLFLSHGYPAEVLVSGGRAFLVRRRDEPDDLTRPQQLHRAPAADRPRDRTPAV